MALGRNVQQMSGKSTRQVTMSSAVPGSGWGRTQNGKHRIPRPPSISASKELRGGWTGDMGGVGGGGRGRRE